MVESTVSLSRAYATGAWVVASLLLVAAWIVYPTGSDHLAILLALTCVPFVALAVTLTIHGWMSRLCQVVRVTARHEPPDGVVPMR